MTELVDIKVGDRTVRPSLGLIMNGEESVRVEPRSIEVLVALAERGRQVYPKKELIEAVWGEAFVSDEVLTHAIWDLRKAFGDSASNPKFIQTIPKRGYRLIAPVETIEPERAATADRGASQDLVLWIAGGAALLLAASVALLSPGGGLPRRLLSAEPTLAIVGSTAERHDTELSERLAENLRGELAGSAGLAPLRAGSCETEAPVPADYCLEVRVTQLAASYEARVELLQGGRSVFAPRALPYAPGGDVEATLASQVAAYFEVIAMPYFHDSDSRPFFDLGRHDSRAVAAFLKGMEKVYENEVGARVQLDLAIELDPDFVAPRIVRIPTLMAETESATIEAHLAHLEAVRSGATAFEQELIGFARAHYSGAYAEQIRWLRGALRSAPGNRPVTYMLGTLQLEHDHVDQACETLFELVQQGWHYPPAYTDSVSCRLRLGQIEAGRVIARKGMALEKVDPELLLMCVLLSIYDEDAELERRMRRDLRRRIALIEPQRFTFDVSEHQSKLAELAELAGRGETARRLREFVY